MALSKGDRVANYVIEKHLGSGGMASVYRARSVGGVGLDASLDRPVALKVLHPHLASDRAFVEMFMDEASVGARLHHPNVCPVYDAGSEAGIHYIAFQLLEGETLFDLAFRAHTSAGLVPLDEWVALVCRIIADVCEGLHAAHELSNQEMTPLKVVHRDVTPNNVFVCKDGTVRILDFGIACGDGRIHRTVAGTVKGTPSYMSPEHLVGAPVDRRTDVWSLGVVLWETLTGERLYNRGNAALVLDAIRRDPVPHPTSYCPFIPYELSSLVLRALRPDPRARFETARDLGRALRAIARRMGHPVGPAELADLMDRVEEHKEMERFEFADTRVEPSVYGDATRVEEPVHALKTRIIEMRGEPTQRMKRNRPPHAVPQSRPNGQPWSLLGPLARLVS